tara:strand:- start:250 stop:375 length:126 start_codon:yes stop_codon:yes gene_type:complete
MGKSKFISEDLLPEKSEIIFLSIGIMFVKSVLFLVSCSNKG